ncbi:MAG: phage head closure protein [Clostridium sp.]|nr:phage head closure protein [Clostridium sp.]
MVIALLNEKVVFLKNTVKTDAAGNHTNAWEEYYRCFATIGGEGLASSKEKEIAGNIVEDVSMTVTVRYCAKMAQVTSTGYRIQFRGECYDIVNVDHLNFKKRSLKFCCRKVGR